VEAEWLASRLEQGRSIESIAREARRSPSTVGYWVSKHGLTSTHAAKHAARGGIDRAELEALVALGTPIRAMAEQLGVSYTTVRHWLKRYELATPRAQRLASTRSARDGGLDDGVVHCPVHGPTRHVRRTDGWAPLPRLPERRRQPTATSGEGAARGGGGRLLCALWIRRAAGCSALPSRRPRDQVVRAWRHRRDPLAREGSRRGAKCVLLCARCHAEVELGVKRLPLRPMTGGEAVA
jgi:transposase-like protein